MKKDITIQTEDEGPFTLPAFILGPFAIHRPYWRAGRLGETHWTVTHVPTGCKIFTQIAVLNNARKAAKELMALPVDWPGINIETWQDVPSEVKDQMHAIYKKYRC